MTVAVVHNFQQVVAVCRRQFFQAPVIDNQYAGPGQFFELFETRLLQATGFRRFTFVGQRCLALNGVTAEAAMADPNLLYDMILPEHRPAFLAAEAQALAELRPFDIEVAMRRADGEVRWHRIASMPQAMPDGSTVWEGLQIDVTERRRIAAELAEHRRRMELAVEATGLGFWEWDLRTRTLVWSERNKALFGLPAGDAIDIDRYSLPALNRYHESLKKSCIPRYRPPEG